MDGIFEYIRADMPTVLDDKSEHCVPFVLEQIKRHRQAHAHREDGCPPFFVGLNGIQGAGKTTLVSTFLVYLIRQIVRIFQSQYDREVLLDRAERSCC